jgi:hypothetical protein
MTFTQRIYIQFLTHDKHTPSLPQIYKEIIITPAEDLRVNLHKHDVQLRFPQLYQIVATGEKCDVTIAQNIQVVRLKIRGRIAL